MTFGSPAIENRQAVSYYSSQHGETCSSFPTNFPSKLRPTFRIQPCHLIAAFIFGNELKFFRNPGRCSVAPRREIWCLPEIQAVYWRFSLSAIQVLPILAKFTVGRRWWYIVQCQKFGLHMNSVAYFPSPTVQEPPDDSFNVQRSQGEEESIAQEPQEFNPRLFFQQRFHITTDGFRLTIKDFVWRIRRSYTYWWHQELPTRDQALVIQFASTTNFLTHWSQWFLSQALRWNCGLSSEYQLHPRRPLAC